MLIVGGGPAGSSCAWRLRARAARCRRHGSRGVSARQGLRRLDHAAGRSSTSSSTSTTTAAGGRCSRSPGSGQASSARPARSGRAYDQPVSYGIRRCEFDHYLLAAIGRPAARSARPSRRSAAEGISGSSTSHSDADARRRRRPLLPGGPLAERAPPVRLPSAVVARETEFPDRRSGSGRVRDRPSTAPSCTSAAI